MRILTLKGLTHLACKERRDLSLEACDLKFDDKAEKDGSIAFEGYASRWDRTDSYGDTVQKGAFVDSLKSRKPLMLYGHNPGRVIGKYDSVKEDKNGLVVTGRTTPGHTDARDVGASLKFGALNGLSIGGYTLKSNPKDGDEGGRVIKEFELWEISVVSMPAESEARIDSTSVKSMLDECDTISDLEELLREAAGLSKSMATAFVARLKRIVRGEPDANARTNAVADDLLAAVKGTTFPTSLLQVENPNA